MASRFPVTTLKRRADFVSAAGSGVKFVKPTVVVQARKRDPLEFSFSPLRTGFTATKKLGSAVIRNRAKRRLRAAAAQTLPIFGIAGCDYVFIGRDATLTCKFDALIRDLKHALKRLAAHLEAESLKPSASEKP